MAAALAMLLLLIQDRRQKELRAIQAKLDEIDALLRRTACAETAPNRIAEQAKAELLRTPPSQN